MQACTWYAKYNENRVKTLTLLLLGGALCAQERPQFVWQGEVDGIAVLHLRDNKLDVQVQEGGPVLRQQFQFNDRIPEIRQDARLEVRAGRGYAHIVEQPRLENHYTLTVAIEDRQPGSSPYSIALYWDASNRFFEGKHTPGRSDKVSWSGRVNGQATISCRDAVCTSSTEGSVPVADEHFKFSRPLPHRDVEVNLEHAMGRGEIRLAEQPRERNNYTARVSIRDSQGGAGDYSFTLGWSRAKGAPPPPEPARGLVWNGIVDGRVRVTVQGGSSFSQVILGSPIAGEKADFLRPLPSRSDLSPQVKKLRGRGRVEIVEYPSERNHFSLTFEIDNPAGGADSYEIEVDW